MLLAPNTSDIQVIQNIVGRANSALVAMSPNDNALYKPFAKHLDAEQIAAGLNNFPNAVVYKTRQQGHALTDYVQELRQGAKEQLSPKPQ